MAELQVEGIQYRFGRQPVLNGVELEARPGECVVLFGVNGAGKSTLLSLLSTRLRLQHGRYLLNGLDVAHHGDAARAALMLVGHHTHLYGHLSPVENLRFFLDLRGLNPSDARLREVVAEVGLARFADRPAHGFSAGMRKRLALARVLLSAPSLLLLDEPYSSLDAAGVAWLNGVLRRYLTDGGTILLATHDPERVASLPHRPLRLDAGRLRPEDAP